MHSQDMWLNFGKQTMMSQLTLFIFVFISYHQDVSYLLLHNLITEKLSYCSIIGNTYIRSTCQQQKYIRSTTFYNKQELTSYTMHHSHHCCCCRHTIIVKFKTQADRQGTLIYHISTVQQSPYHQFHKSFPQRCH